MDLFARFHANGCGQRDGQVDIETFAFAFGSYGLDFEWVLSLHAIALVYKLAPVNSKRH